ncbi:FMN-dependent NADH-azoreductase [Mucilaginibacter endophyticus]|uniref:FMN-dependent NADH-azoreductase n=1 Tax=Mucilaginibacter endophyticus TaxID=2675003 RepID=UPI000E0D147E|nr:NAD(P)H-dependent oxidoreductase [Mucilaginibacter endophyticus]
MKNILHIISSPKGEHGHSVKLARAIIKQLCNQHKECKIAERDLLAAELPYLDGLHISALFKNEAERSDDENQKLSYSDTVLHEIKAADIIVLGAPMYNFGIHAALKAYIDQIVRFGHTIAYQQDGSRIGLLKDKVVYLAITAGGNYTNSGFDPVKDYIVNYLQTILNYMGIETIIPLIIEGTAAPDFTVDYDLVCNDIQNAATVS